MSGSKIQIIAHLRLELPSQLAHVNRPSLISIELHCSMAAIIRESGHACAQTRINVIVAAGSLIIDILKSANYILFDGIPRTK